MRNLYQLLAITVLLALLSACGSQQSASTRTTSALSTTPVDGVSLAWSAPSTRTDGSYLPLTELAGYRVYYGTTADDMAPLVDLNDIAITQYTVSNLPAGNYYFAVSVYDIDGLESGYSQVILIHMG